MRQRESHGLKVRGPSCSSVIPFVDSLRIEEWFLHSFGVSFPLINIFANRLKISPSSITLEEESRDALRLNEFDLFC